MPYLASFMVQFSTKLYAFDVSEIVPHALLVFCPLAEYSNEDEDIIVDGWLKFHCNSGNKLLSTIKTARAKIWELLDCKLREPTYDWSASTELAAVVWMLRTNGLGFERTKPLTLPARNMSCTGQNPLVRIAVAKGMVIFGV